MCWCRARSKNPRTLEIAILRVLWSRGPSTVRNVARAMEREVAYTTILKLLQNMTAKRLVRRDESSRSHVYTAARSEQDTQRALVADFVELVFDGSRSKLIIEALAVAKPSPEVTEIRKLLACKREIGR